MKWRPPFVPGPFGIALDVRGGIVADVRQYVRVDAESAEIQQLKLNTTRYYTVGGIGMLRGFGRGMTLNTSGYIGMAIGDGTNSVKNDRIMGAMAVFRYRLFEHWFISPALEVDLQRWEYEKGETKLSMQEIDRRLELGIGIVF